MAALFVFEQRRRKQRTFKGRISTLDHLSDVEVVDRYRLSRIAIIYLEENLRNDLSPPTNRSQSVSSMTKVLVELRVLSKGNFLSEVADLYDISKQTASRVLHEFVDAVNRNIDNIRFPRTQQELAEAKLQKMQNCQYRRCSRRNTCPYHCPERQWRSLHMPERIPCYKRDGYMKPRQKEHMESERPGMLLADGGYPLTTSLLTPFANPITPAEARYNNAQSYGRMVTEQTFGILRPYTSSITDFIVEPFLRL